MPDGVSLTIEPGVVIKGDKATQGTLIIVRGGKIMAQGTPERPIVFTSAQAPGSRKPGDWGGIILLGKAPNNLGEQTIEGGVRSKHGGNDPADNSGVLSYVRVEFPGIEYSTDNEINGITFGSVGSGTKIDHLQVSYSVRRMRNISSPIRVGTMISIPTTASAARYSSPWACAIRG